MPDPLGNLQGATGHELSGMATKHLAHGSGKIGENSRILAYSYYNETGIVPVQGNVELEPVIDEENITASPSISIQEDTSMVYSPFGYSSWKWLLCSQSYQTFIVAGR